MSRLFGGELKSNLGDLLRSTVLLKCIGDDFIWLTDTRGKGLLDKFIISEKIFVIEDGLADLSFHQSLEIYNLDNYIADIDLFRTLKGSWHGYLWNGRNEVIPENDLIKAIQPYSTGKELNCSWQEAFIKGLGFEWCCQDYADVLCLTPEIVDVGLNWNVHLKWTSKQWLRSSWEELYNTLIKKGITVSWQVGLDDFNKYVNWISSCRIIVTCDTLGLHLASALRKQVIAIVGATENYECSYRRISFIKPTPRDCMPCNKPVCDKVVKCIDEIDVSMVLERIDKYLFRDLIMRG